MAIFYNPFITMLPASSPNGTAACGWDLINPNGGFASGPGRYLDITGNGNNLYELAGSTPVNDPGFWSLDGTNEALQSSGTINFPGYADRLTTLGTNNFLWSAWIRLRTPQTGTIFFNGQLSGNPGSLRFDCSQLGSVATGTFTFQSSGGFSGQIQLPLLLNDNNDGRWVHCVAARVGNEFRAYANGVKSTQTQSSSDALGSVLEWVYGGGINAGSGFVSDNVPIDIGIPIFILNTSVTSENELDQMVTNLFQNQKDRFTPTPTS